jgi:peptidoglycan hydrolase-like protein with peptidoglycan-binding domain
MTPRSRPVPTRAATSADRRVRVFVLAPLACLLVACSTTVSSAPLDPTVTTTETTAAPATTEVPETTATTDVTTTTLITPTTMPVFVEAVAAPLFPVLAVGGHSGPDTVNVQARLTDLGFWVGDADGRYGFATKQGVMAFQKYAGLPASGNVDEATAAQMNTLAERAHGTANSGTLVEVDKRRQLLFIIADGHTLWTFNTSTGSEKPYQATNHNDPTKIETGDAVTPNGLWKVVRERPDGWWEGDLGRIYRPKYFHNGIAIHGMTKVPNFPASHGCVRVSVPAMDFIWDAGLVPVGTPVWVHE